MPLVVATTISSGKLPVQQAGGVTSAYWIGILLTTLLLPLVAVRVTARNAASFALMVPILGVGSTLVNGPAFLITWILLGGACGVLSFAGSTFAAATRNPDQVFALRLGCVLLAAIAALVLASFVLGTTTYVGAVSSLVVVALVVSALGVWLYRAPQTSLILPATSGKSSSGPVAWHLLLVVLFFIGQPGFLAYAAHTAVERGLDPAQLYIAFGLSKVTGVAALCFMRTSSSTTSVAWLSMAVAVGIVFVARADAMLLFALGLVLWEMAINPLSARLQGTIVRQAPSIAGRWLPAALGIGACVGPALHGIALHAEAGVLFVAYSIASSFLPLAVVAPYRKVQPN